MGCIRIHQIDKEIAQRAPLDRFSGILREARGGRVTLTLGHDVSRERNYRDVRVMVLFFPSTDLAAGFVAIFIGHLNVALRVLAVRKEGCKSRERIYGASLLLSQSSTVEHGRRPA